MIDPQTLLSNAPAIVKAMTALSHLPPAEAHAQALASLADTPAPLVSHLRQVCGATLLIALQTGSPSLDELLELAQAALLHDLGMSKVPRPFLMRYLRGESATFNSDEARVFHEHTDMSAELIKRAGIALSPTVLRTMEHHHENCDGSGPRKKAEREIFRHARILRIADELVTLMVRADQPLSYGSAIARLREMRGRTLKDLYDPEILAKLYVKSSPPKQSKREAAPKPR